MKVDEPFNPEIKSASLPLNLEFKIADESHFDQIVKLMCERNPLDSLETIQTKTNREIKLNKEDPLYWLYVATIKDEVVGFCRFYHSDGLPESRKKFPAPAGWYGMGILVANIWRRKNIARYLTNERINRLKELKATSLYSVVDSTNLTSRKMHEEFGFKKVEEARGFLNLDFKDQIAYLYKLTL